MDPRWILFTAAFISAVGATPSSEESRKRGLLSWLAEKVLIPKEAIHVSLANGHPNPQVLSSMEYNTKSQGMGDPGEFAQEMASVAQHPNMNNPMILTEVTIEVPLRMNKEQRKQLKENQKKARKAEILTRKMNDFLAEEAKKGEKHRKRFKPSKA